MACYGTGFDGFRWHVWIRWKDFRINGACNPRLRAKHFWLVRLKLDQALVGLLACHAECSSEVAQWSPTHLHGLQPSLESLKTDSQVPMNQEQAR